MNQKEVDDFLTESRCIARISSLNNDGSIHTVPVWYEYKDGKVLMTSDDTSHHVKNIKKRNRVTVLIDTVQFPTKGVRITGSASIEEDKVHDLEMSITRRYIDDDKRTQEYVKSRESKAKRVAISVTPDKISSWDFSKNREERDFFKNQPVYSLNPQGE